MYKKLLLSAVLAVSTFTLFIQGANAATVSDVPASIGKAVTQPTASVFELLKEKVVNELGLTGISIEATPMPGMAVIISDQGIYYSDYQGDFLLQGPMFNLGESITNLTEITLSKVRIEGMKTFEDDMIVYKAKDEKYVVTAFTDITCGYCRKMHAQMAEYNAKGITFRYLAYPRSGLTDKVGNLTSGFKDLRSVWCNENPEKALTTAKSGGNVAYKSCDKGIEKQFIFGRKVGVTGTPAIMLSNGGMIPGYQPPEKLREILDTL